MRAMVVLLLAVLSANCGGFDCEFRVQGICVVANDHKVSKPMVKTAVKVAGLGMTDKFPDFNMDAFLDENTSDEVDTTIQVHYLDPKDMKGKRGVTFDGKTIAVGWATKWNAAGDCMDRYYVLSHELLHVIATYYLGVDEKTNGAHDVPKVFLQWADDTGAVYSDAAEFNIYLDMVDECEAATGTQLGE